MPNLEWEVSHDLVTPGGTIPLNQVVPLSSGGPLQGGRIWQIQPDYKIIPTLRLTADNVSQADGSVIHPRYKTGMLATFSVEYKTSITGEYPGEVAPAVGANLREMHELLMGALDSIRDLPADALGILQRLIWEPTGYGDHRMLDKIVLNAWPDVSRVPEANSVSVAVETEFPYAIDETEVDRTISGSGSITNAGNTPYWPVIHVTPSSDFQIVNTSVVDDDGNPFGIYFNASLPGGLAVASPYAEINTFRGTIFHNGDGADLIASIDPTLSDFFPLVPGVNNITVLGTTATFLTNNAWT